MTMVLRKYLPLSLLAIVLVAWNFTRVDKRFLEGEENLTAREKRKRRVAAIVSKKPIMHTFADRDAGYVDEELLTIWTNAWTRAGWDVKILTTSDAMKHPDYRAYAYQLDRKKLCCLPRDSYLRHIAMGAIDGGFYSEQYVFPLHKLSDMAEGQDIINGKLPNNGEITSFDGVIASILSGSKDEWNRINEALMKIVDRNVVISFQKMFFGNETKFNWHSDEMYGNFFFFLQDVCEKSKDKFVIRFHEHDLKQWGFEQYTRPFVVSKWLEQYNSLCWPEDRRLAKVFNNSTQHELY